MNSPYEGQITIDAQLLHALWCYGNLHTVEGVIYQPGSHQECLAIVDSMFSDRARGLNRAAPTAMTPTGDDDEENDLVWRLLHPLWSHGPTGPAHLDRDAAVSDMRQAAAEIQRLSAPSPSTASNAEPVAYRWRFAGENDDEWSLRKTKPPALVDAHVKVEFQPLYATPPSSGNADAVREALRLMVYETTHLSAEEDDGGHKCTISGETLRQARAALTRTRNDRGGAT